MLIAGERQIIVPAELLPHGAAEGDHITISFEIDSRATQEASAQIEKLQKRLSENSKESDRR